MKISICEQSARLLGMEPAGFIGEGVVALNVLAVIPPGYGGETRPAGLCFFSGDSGSPGRSKKQLNAWGLLHRCR
ncbi:hypothetical protein [Methanoculleus horonobensis]|uniref:hypothetical protein n=1 Tax=Methanoculleus horonobensis TaxID=528314 RepID=UPI0013737150|nr:hypothetical protein [Methanoculleus horonobensis]